MERRVETHQIKRSHELFEFCNEITLKSKNLYNAVLYRLKQKYKDGEEFSTANSTLYKNYKHLDEFKEVGSGIANLTLRQLSMDYKSFYQSMKSYKKDKSKFNNPPRPPNYKPAGPKGRFQASWQATLRKDNTIKVPKRDIYIDFIQNTDKKIKQVQIEPSDNEYHRNIYFNLKIIYEKEMPNLKKQNGRIAGIDLGKGNLATVATNKRIKPITVNGRPLCSMGDYFLKKRKKLMSNVKGRGISNRIKQLDQKFRNKQKNYMHNVSRIIVDWCKKHNIETIIVGKNKNWKKEINIGRQQNYHFTIIPFKMLIEQIEYKAEELGISVELTEESYTSKASFLDGDELPEYKKGEENNYSFSGKRVKRGLYKASNGVKINADVNGAYNIIRKAYPEKIDNSLDNKDLLHPQKINIKEAIK